MGGVELEGWRGSGGVGGVELSQGGVGGSVGGNKGGQQGGKGEVRGELGGAVRGVPYSRGGGIPYEGEDLGVKSQGGLESGGNRRARGAEGEGS